MPSVPEVAVEPKFEAPKAPETAQAKIEGAGAPEVATEPKFEAPKAPETAQAKIEGAGVPEVTTEPKFEAPKAPETAQAKIEGAGVPEVTTEPKFEAPKAPETAQAKIEGAGVPEVATEPKFEAPKAPETAQAKIEGAGVPEVATEPKFEAPKAQETAQAKANPEAAPGPEVATATPKDTAPKVEPASQPQISYQGPGSVERGALDDKEFQQAQEIVQYRGGKFVGNDVPNAPGIDGQLDGVPVSLKETSSSDVDGLIREARRARKSASDAGYSGVETYIKAPNISIEDISNAPNIDQLLSIPKGTISSVTIMGNDGVLRIVPGKIVR